MQRPFLTAQWRNLVMLNFAAEPSILAPKVPRGTTLDSWQGTTYVSLVGFLFDDTRVLGIPVPLHRTFEEVNLRFYVRRTLPNEVRRGVTFVRELVPRVAIATTARLLYNEPYRSLPMLHSFGPSGEEGMPQSVEYAWRTGNGWTSLRAEARGVGQQPAPDSREAFITEHYWGYTRQRDGGTVEYQVTHPRWKVWTADVATINGDLEGVYGGELAAVLRGRPSSAFIADGSAVTVHAPSRMS
ncbi:MAG: DUF2071 domain-containing protein [Gemmatimonadota bacterium]|nr:DUF2071 domain-containing protein [Gemmatimonadota bacterium]